MPSLDVLRSIALHLLTGALSGMAWAWVLTIGNQLEQRLGVRVPFAGGIGAGSAIVVLLLGGWQLLVPIQRWLLVFFRPLESMLFVVLVLLSWSLWIGFALGLGLGACQRPAVVNSPQRFGFRRRR